jgi:hypothetical protein
MSTSYDSTRFDGPVKFILPEKVAVHDYRKEECVKLSSKYAAHGNVSLIIDAHKENIRYLSVTIMSALHTTKHVPQITVLIDASVSPSLYRKAVSLFIGIKYIDFIHLEANHGQIAARAQGAKVSREDVLVFVESGVWFSAGWLEPLLDTLASHPKSIVLPRYDTVRYEAPAFRPLPDPQYRVVSLEWTPILTWDMRVALYPAPDMPQRQRTIETPAIRPDIFAVRRSHYEAVGEFFELSSHPGAAHIELSIRQWRCDGPIRVVRCSRVAIRDTSDVSTGNLANMGKITSKWLPSLAGNISEALGSQLQLGAVPSRQCVNLESWFGRVMMPDFLTRPDPVLHSGKLRSGDAACMNIAADGSHYLERDCKEAPDFALTRSGHLQHVSSKRCLTAAQNYHWFTHCVPELTAQQWLYDGGHGGHGGGSDGGHGGHGGGSDGGHGGHGGGSDGGHGGGSDGGHGGHGGGSDGGHGGHGGGSDGGHGGSLRNVGSLRCLMQMSDSQHQDLQIAVGERCERITAQNQQFAKWTFV